jgi:hypothetical protein
LIRSNTLWHRGTKNISKKLRFLFNFILKNKKEKLAKLNFIKDNKLKVEQNFFDNSINGKLKEILYTRFSYLYSSLRVLLSFFKIN